MRRSCWLEESKKEARVEGHVAGGAAAALGGESSHGTLNGEEGGGDRMECGVGWRARGRTALKAEHGRSERAPPLAAGERLPRGGRGQG